MPFVLDTSVTACWCFPDERNEKADAILKLLLDDNALVPVIWWFEIRNVLLVGERRQRLSGDDVIGLFNWIGELAINLADLPPAASVLNLARRHRLTFYDAAYVELAKRERLSLATFDKDLIAAARAEGVSLIE